MLPRKIFEILHTVVAILVLFEQVLGKFCLNFLPLILSAVPQSCQRAEDFGAGPARTRFFKPEPGPNPNPNLSVRPSPILSPKSKTSHYLLKNL